MRYLDVLREAGEVEKTASIKDTKKKYDAAKKKTVGYEKREGESFYPIPPVTLGSLASATKIPTTKPMYEMVLLPNAKYSPTLGLGLGGLQTRLRVKRPTEGVPAESVVGKGLENQSAIGGAADISVKPKTAGVIAQILSCE